MSIPPQKPTHSSPTLVLDTDSSNPDQDAEDPLRILASRLLKANAGNPGKFAFATQIDVQEPETYSRSMS